MLRAGIGLLLLVWSALVCAVDITGQIRWNDVCPNATALGHAKVLLDEGIYHGSVTSNGKFVIPDAPDGTYILSIESHDYAFDQYRIDVNQSSISPVEVRPHSLGISMNPPSEVTLFYPLSIAAKEKFVYFLPRESFNLGGMLSSPMMLAMIACGVLVLAMPYIMKNMDPETLEEFKREQARMSRKIYQGNTTSDSTVSSAVEEKVAAPRINKANPKTKAGTKKSKR